MRPQLCFNQHPQYSWALCALITIFVCEYTIFICEYGQLVQEQMGMLEPPEPPPSYATGHSSGSRNFRKEIVVHLYLQNFISHTHFGASYGHFNHVETN